MPNYQKMFEIANRMLSREFIDDIELGGLNPELPFSVIATGLGVATNDAERAVLDALPLGQQAALRAALRSALSRDERMPVQLIWAPGYDNELTIWESQAIPGSRGAMSVLLKTRYPNDPLPGGVGMIVGPD